jgi:hypothetical protein
VDAVRAEPLVQRRGLHLQALAGRPDPIVHRRRVRTRVAGDGVPLGRLPPLSERGQRRARLGGALGDEGRVLGGQPVVLGRRLLVALGREQARRLRQLPLGGQVPVHRELPVGRAGGPRPGQHLLLDREGTVHHGPRLLSTDCSAPEVSPIVSPGAYEGTSGATA